MPTIDPRIASQLQLLCSVKTYTWTTRPIQPSHRYFSAWTAGDKYWRLIPHYRVSRCPFCGLDYSAQFDSYSLAHTAVSAPMGLQIAPGEKHDAKYQHETTHCQHFVACEPFNYLNEFDAWQEGRYTRGSHAPGIQPHLLSYGVETIAVIHALPICRIENNEFVPRFTKFLITYFASSAWALYEAWREQFDDDADDVPLLYKNPDTHLSSWVERGQLKWLDLDTPDQSLRSTPLADFPYNNIVVKSPPVRDYFEPLNGRERPLYKPLVQIRNIIRRIIQNKR